MKGSRLVIFAWMVAIAVITWANVKVAQKAPPASAFVGTGIVYPIAAAITAIPTPAAQMLGGAFAVGWTLNLIYMASGALKAPQGDQQKAPAGQDQGQGNVTQLNRYKRKPSMPPGSIEPMQQGG